MDMNAWPKLIETITTFWDDSRMVFHFGVIEMTPIIEEIMKSFKGICMAIKKKTNSDEDILFLQDVPQVKNMDSYKVDYTDETVSLAMAIIQEWKSRRVCRIKDIAPDRFNAGYFDLYKSWLKEDLARTVEPGPNI
ncbi:hypothetical protein HAX54_044904 [Datura stramonium]|uniref:Uncharacterized protein n=1 Tax=Datura stramonium TaxID=4076 RepID=A0ABS8SQB1_DATST|nr:hypothetical protein [Datura stramonium]